MVVGRRDLRKVVGYLVECALPKIAGEGEHVGLVDQGEVMAGRTGSQLESEADGSLDPHPGVDRALGGDLVRRPLAQESALAGVRALCVLTDDLAVERADGAGPCFEGAQVDVEVELEAGLQEQTPLDDPWRYIGCADSTKEDRVEAPPLFQDRIREDFACLQIMRAALGVRDEFERNARRDHDLQRLGDDFGTDPVSADNSDLGGHGTTIPFAHMKTGK